MLGDDWYCRNILSEELEVDVVHRGREVIAFHHTRPFWQEDIVIVPLRHVVSLTALEADDIGLSLELMSVTSMIARSLELQWGGCGVLTNIGERQSTKHLHIHVHAGERIRDQNGVALSSSASKE